MKLKELEKLKELVTAIQIPNSETFNLNDDEIAFTLKFKYGVRTLLKEVCEAALSNQLDLLGKMIHSEYGAKWQQNYKALTSEYDVLNSSTVIYDETSDSESTASMKNTSTSEDNEEHKSNQNLTSQITAFDSPADYDNDTHNAEDSSSTSSTRSNDTSDSTNNSNISSKKGYVKKYSNGLDGASAIEKDISTRKSKYLDIVTSDIINYITLLIY